MEIPFPGEELGGFVVEYVDVQHQGSGGGRYEYPVRLILQGKGGKQGVRNALRNSFSESRTTFSGYGNPYHCRMAKWTVESLGDQRYEVKAQGIGVRIFLRRELDRFYQHLKSEGVAVVDGSGLKDLIEAYMDEYLKGISRTSAAYKRRIQKID